MVPHLTTALTGPINELEQRILESMPATERWFRLEWMEHTPPFYAAVDLRNAGFKLAPVATDLFPTGFNNLTPEMLPLAVQAAMAAIEKICPEARNLLLIPALPPEAESPHGRGYAEHLQRLVEIFGNAGLNVRLGGADPALKAPFTLPWQVDGGGELKLEPLVRNRGRLGLKDFDPCTILLNNDLVAGVPRALEHIHEQYLLPPLHAGWGVRRKSRHFQSYEEVAKKFAKLLGMDPWLINPMHGSVARFNFETPGGLEGLKSQVDAVLTKVRRKYKEYGINERPFVVVKADALQDGGIMLLRDAKELDDPARVARGRATLEAGGSLAAGLLVQEGVPTSERINEVAAEPVVLTIDRYVVGGYYRAHAGRGADEDLGARGSPSGPRYVPLAFAPSSQLPRPGAKPGASSPNRFYMYGVIGRLAMLAAAYELEATDPEAESFD